MSLNGNYKRVDELLRLVSDYNARKHRTIGMRPTRDRRNILGHSVQRDKDRGSCKVGDSVRVGKYKTIFEKGYTSNWTTEMFTIVKVRAAINPI